MMLAWTIYISFLGALLLLLLPKGSAAPARILALLTALVTLCHYARAFLQHRTGEMFTVTDVLLDSVARHSTITSPPTASA